MAFELAGQTHAARHIASRNWFQRNAGMYNMRDKVTFRGARIEVNREDSRGKETTRPLG